MNGAPTLNTVTRYHLLKIYQKKNESLTIRTRNLQTLAEEMFKTLLTAITAGVFHV